MQNQNPFFLRWAKNSSQNRFALNGIQGIACFIVFFFVLFFYRTYMSGAQTVRHPVVWRTIGGAQMGLPRQIQSVIQTLSCMHLKRSFMRGVFQTAIQTQSWKNPSLQYCRDRYLKTLLKKEKNKQIEGKEIMRKANIQKENKKVTQLKMRSNCIRLRAALGEGNEVVKEGKKIDRQKEKKEGEERKLPNPRLGIIVVMSLIINQVSRNSQSASHFRSCRNVLIALRKLDLNFLSH